MRKGAVAINCQLALNKLRDEKKYRYVILDIRSSDFQITVAATGDRDAEFEDFVEDLTRKGPNECCYGIFDYNSPIASKIFLLMYLPEMAQIPKKKIYKRGFVALRRLMKGIEKFIIALDISELGTDTIEEKLRHSDPGVP